MKIQEAAAIFRQHIVRASGFMPFAALQELQNAVDAFAVLDAPQVQIDAKSDSAPTWGLKNGEWERCDGATAVVDQKSGKWIGYSCHGVTAYKKCTKPGEKTTNMFQTPWEAMVAVDVSYPLPQATVRTWTAGEKYQRCEDVEHKGWTYSAMHDIVHAITEPGSDGGWTWLRRKPTQAYGHGVSVGESDLEQYNADVAAVRAIPSMRGAVAQAFDRIVDLANKGRAG